jgi:hypothetical protein
MNDGTAKANDSISAAGGRRKPITMPTDAALDAARAERKAAGEWAATARPGQVQGLPDGWVAAKIDPALDEGTKARLRASWKAKGWVSLEGLHVCVGYPNGVEVWVKRSGDFNADRAERDQRLAELVRRGLRFKS